MRTGIVVVLVLVAGGAIATAPTSGATQFALSTPTTVDGPTRTVTLGETAYTITDVGQISPGTDLQVDVAAPADSAYDLYLYDAERRIVDTVSMQGSGTATLATASLAPGSYLVAVYDDGRFPTVLPVVIAGYETAVDAPRSVGTGSRLSVALTLANVTDAPAPSAVEVALVRNETVVWRAQARLQSARHYTLTRRVTVTPGQYALLVSVRGETTIKGHKQVLGLSDRHPITVSARNGTPRSGTTTPRTDRARDTPASTRGVLTPVSPDAAATTEATGPNYALHVLALLGLIYASLRRCR